MGGKKCVKYMEYVTEICLGLINSYAIVFFLFLFIYLLVYLVVVLSRGYSKKQLPSNIDFMYSISVYHS